MNGYGPYRSNFQYGGYDPLEAVRNIGAASTPTPELPFSPVVDPGVRNYLEEVSQIGASPPQWRNPYQWQSWGNSKGLGDFLGGNAPLFMAGLNTLSGLTQAYTGLKGLGLAKSALRQQKKEFNVNLDNQVRSYNTQVGDMITGRQYASEAERQAALAAAQLVNRSKYGKGG